MAKRADTDTKTILYALREVERRGKDGFTIGIGGPDDVDVDIASELEKGVSKGVVTKKQISDAQRQYENGRGITDAQEVFHGLEKYGVHPGQLDSPNEVSALELGIKKGLYSLNDVQRKLATYESSQGRRHLALVSIAIASFVGGFAFLSPSITGNAVSSISEGVRNPIGGMLLLSGIFCSALILGLGKRASKKKASRKRVSNRK